MSDFFLGEIRPVAFSFAPQGWATCSGQLLSIAQNTALFSLIGTYYGGNGTSTFALPDLRGRVAVSQGQLTGGEAYVVGEQLGEEAHTVLVSEMPVHTHVVSAADVTATTSDPTQGVFAIPAVNSRMGTLYASSSTTTNSGVVGSAGSGQPHSNQQPFLTALYCIALTGIYPSRN